MKKLIKLSFVLATTISIASCSCEHKKEPIPKNPYEIMAVAFEGFPEKNSISAMMEPVMDRHKIEKTDKNRTDFADMLLRLRKGSALGVTEMDILKHMYQKGSGSNTLVQQAALSATYLEETK